MIEVRADRISLITRRDYYLPILPTHPLHALALVPHHACTCTHTPPSPHDAPQVSSSELGALGVMRGGPGGVVQQRRKPAEPSVGTPHQHPPCALPVCASPVSGGAASELSLLAHEVACRLSVGTPRPPTCATPAAGCTPRDSGDGGIGGSAQSSPEDGSPVISCEEEEGGGDLRRRPPTGGAAAPGDSSPPPLLGCPLAVLSRVDGTVAASLPEEMRGRVTVLQGQLLQVGRVGGPDRGLQNMPRSRWVWTHKITHKLVWV